MTGHDPPLLLLDTQVLNQMMASLVIGEPGSSQLISIRPAKRMKLGVVSISANDIATQLKALDEQLILHPVTLKPSK